MLLSKDELDCDEAIFVPGTDIVEFKLNNHRV